MSRKKPTTSKRSSTSSKSRRAQPNTAKESKARPGSPRSRVAARHSLQAARYLWAIVTGLVIAALLFEPTMVWTIGVGVFMIANAELIGLWLLVAGYGMSCLPVTFGLLIATGRFWFSLTHGLWTGALYSVTGFLFLEQVIGIVSTYGPS